MLINGKTVLDIVEQGRELQNEAIMRDMNEVVLKENSGTNAIEQTKGEIIAMRHEIERKLAHLAVLERGSGKSLFTYGKLAGIFREHGSMSISYGDGNDIIEVAMHDMPMNFHKKRDSLQHPANDCVVYTTTPHMNFKAVLMPNGKIGIYRTDNQEGMEREIRNAPLVADVRHRSEGISHPNSQVENKRSGLLHICYGNNGFFDEYRDIVESGNLNATSMLMLFNNIGKWFKNANLDDMFGTLATPDVVLKSQVFCADAVRLSDELLKTMFESHSEAGPNNWSETMKVVLSDGYQRIYGDVVAEVFGKDLSTENGTLVREIRNGTCLKLAYGLWLLPRMESDDFHERFCRPSLKAAVAYDVARILNAGGSNRYSDLDSDFRRAMSWNGVALSIMEMHNFIGGDVLGYAHI